MYAGKVVESGDVDAVLDRPGHPYTEGLIGSVPSRNKRGHALTQIPGMTPSLLNLPVGCAFRQRCRYADQVCETAPNITTQEDHRKIRCHHVVEAAVNA